MIRYVKFSNINNVITRVRYSIKSFIIILLIVKKIEASIGTSIVSIGFAFRMHNGQYLATSAYVSIAFMLSLFFSATGMIIFLTLNRSPTFSNANCKKILRYPSK